MGCSGSTAVAPAPALMHGVSAAFEFQDVDGSWKPITEPGLVLKLRTLCAKNDVHSVTYSYHQNQYRVQMQGGALVQTNITTGTKRNLRLVAFNFEYREGGRWHPFTDAPAIQALTSLLASAMPHKYWINGVPYEATLLSNQGRILQKNLSTDLGCLVRASCIGPDGEPHFEYRDGDAGNDDWKRVPDGPPSQAMLAVVSGSGSGRMSYSVGQFQYEATFDSETGFVIQRNLQTNKERPVRPAPWLGHGVAPKSIAQAAMSVVTNLTSTVSAWQSAANAFPQGLDVTTPRGVYSINVTKTSEGFGFAFSKSNEVTTLLPGGAFDQTGVVSLGDRILSVNGKACTGGNTPQTLLAGAPNGSAISFTLQKKLPDTTLSTSV